jgi:hypothetical protein
VARFPAYETDESPPVATSVGFVGRRAEAGLLRQRLCRMRSRTDRLSRSRCRRSPPRPPARAGRRPGRRGCRPGPPTKAGPRRSCRSKSIRDIRKNRRGAPDGDFCEYCEAIGHVRGPKRRADPPQKPRGQDSPAAGLLAAAEARSRLGIVRAMTTARVLRATARQAEFIRARWLRATAPKHATQAPVFETAPRLLEGQAPQ